MDILINRLAARAHLARRPDLKALDAERERDPRWFRANTLLGGIAYVDLFAGNRARDLQRQRREAPRAAGPGSPWRRGWGMASQIWGGGGGPPSQRFRSICAVNLATSSRACSPPHAAQSGSSSPSDPSTYPPEGAR